VAAIIFEPVQGEGGFNPVLPEAVKWLRAVCDEHGIVEAGADPICPACRWVGFVRPRRRDGGAPCCIQTNTCDHKLEERMDSPWEPSWRS